MHIKTVRRLELSSASSHGLQLLTPGSEKALRDTGQKCGTWGLALSVSHKLSQAQFLPVHQPKGEIHGSAEVAQGPAPAIAQLNSALPPRPKSGAGCLPVSC